MFRIKATYTSTSLSKCSIGSSTTNSGSTGDDDGDDDDDDEANDVVVSVADIIVPLVGVVTSTSDVPNLADDDDKSRFSLFILLVEIDLELSSVVCCVSTFSDWVAWSNKVFSRFVVDVVVGNVAVGTGCIVRLGFFVRTGTVGIEVAEVSMDEFLGFFFRPVNVLIGVDDASWIMLLYRPFLSLGFVGTNNEDDDGGACKIFDSPGWFVNGGKDDS
jgi:hypothetical protein